MIAALLNPYAWLAGAAVVGGLWFGHTRAVSQAYAAGEAARQTLWTAADNIAKAVGEAKTKLLARAAIKETETLHERIRKAEQLAVARGSALRDRDSQSASLQQRSDVATSEADSRASSTPAGSDERRIASCERLVGEADRLAGEIDRLAEEVRSALAREQERLASLRRWAAIVEFANEAP
jgi:hypothetical protein